MSKKTAKEKLDVAKTRAAITQAYKTGYSAGIGECQKRLNCLRTTNGYLWRELTKLDETEPSEGIQISIAFAKRLVTVLKKQHNTYARDISRQIRNSNQPLNNLLEILDHCKDYK